MSTSHVWERENEEEEVHESGTDTSLTALCLLEARNADVESQFVNDTTETGREEEADEQEEEEVSAAEEERKTKERGSCPLRSSFHLSSTMDG